MTSTFLHKLLPLATLVTISLAWGCVAENASHPVDDELSSSTPIVNGTKATAHPEAVLIDMYENGQLSSYCSGSLISPRIVLTAGHCVDGITAWKVTAPFASGQSATSSKGIVYDWHSTSQNVDPNLHDIGLIVLDKAITLSQYPSLASSPVPNGTKAITIGRINNGSLSTTALYQSQPIALSSASSVGFPFDYQGSDVIQSGDSGGPVELTGSAPYTLVAVNSGGGNGAVFARVDLLSTWIQAQIKANGGAGAGTGSTGTTPTNPTGPTTCPGGALEKEANDSYPSANNLGPITCGSLSPAGDQDWFMFSVASAGLSYDLRLSSKADFTLQMWKKVNGKFYQVTNTSPTAFSYSTSSAATYYVVVYSPTNTTGSYTLNLTK